MHVYGVYEPKPISYEAIYVSNNDEWKATVENTNIPLH